MICRISADFSWLLAHCAMGEMLEGELHAAMLKTGSIPYYESVRNMQRKEAISKSYNFSG